MKKLHPTVYRLINPMKHTLKTILMTGSILAMLTPMARSATVNWDTPANILADTDISTTGTFERAYNFGDAAAPATTINGVTFSSFAIANTQTSVTNGNTTLSASAINGYAGFGSASTPFASLTPEYQTLLGAAAYQFSVPLTLTLNGLIAGHTYLFQTFSNDSEDLGGVNRTGTVTGGINTVTLDYNTAPSNAGGGTGQYVIGTFIADSSSQTITFNPGVSGLTLVSGFQLRETAVPEPSAISLALLSCGISALVVRARRRKNPIPNA